MTQGFINNNFTFPLPLSAVNGGTGTAGLGQLDLNGNYLFTYTATGSAVNYFNVKNGATGSPPTLSVAGSDANRGMNFQSKGTGGYGFLGTSGHAAAFYMYENTSNGTDYIAINCPEALAAPYTITLPLADAKGVMTSDGSGTLSLTPTPYMSGIKDNNGNTMCTFTTVTSAVNYWNIYNNSTGQEITQVANGSDSNIGMCWQGKGTGTFRWNNVGGTGTPIFYINNAANTFVTQINWANVTANRTYTFPDQTLDFTPATQAQQETATSTSVFIPPGRQQYHPSAAKAWVQFTSVTTTSITSSYNVASLTDLGTGQTQINYTTSFSSANYAAIGMGNDAGSGVGFSMAQEGTKATGSVPVICIKPSTLAAGDTANQCVVCFGDQ